MWSSFSKDLNIWQAVRAAQDEQIRLKDIEVNELKSARMDIERDYRDTRTCAEKVSEPYLRLQWFY